jgi:hypothetical protein
VRWLACTVLMILGTDLKLFSVSNYPFSLTLLLLPFWLVNTFKIDHKIKKKSIAFFCFFAVIPFVNFIDIYSWPEFFKSYFQILVNIFIFLFLCYHREMKKNNETIKATIITAQIAILSLAIIQFVELNITGTLYFWNPWGDFSAGYVISSASGRVKAFFHEPSHLAGITIFLFWMRAMLEERLIASNLFFTTLILVLARSGAGLLVFPIIFIFLFYNSRRWYVSVSLLLILMIPVAAVVVTNWRVVEKTTKIHQFKEITTGSSAFMRWVLPSSIIIDHWSNDRYFGYAMGQIGNAYFREFDPLIDKLDISESAIANGLLALQIHFGIIFNIFLSYLFMYKYPKYSKNRKALIFINFVGLTMGGFFMIQFFFIRLMLPIVVIKAIEKQNA